MHRGEVLARCYLLQFFSRPGQSRPTLLIEVTPPMTPHLLWTTLFDLRALITYVLFLPMYRELIFLYINCNLTALFGFVYNRSLQNSSMKGWGMECSHQDLLTLLATDIHQAFPLLVECYSHRLYTFAYRLVGSQADAEDIVNEMSKVDKLLLELYRVTAFDTAAKPLYNPCIAGMKPIIMQGAVPSMKHLHAVILAGGSGTRLWPLSTPSFPKQFLPLPNGRSLIQESLFRVAPLIAPEHAWVVTGRSMAELAHEHLPSVPVAHILGEPMGRNTAAAIGWAAAAIARQDPQAIMAALTADHFITDTEAFNEALRLAYEWAEAGSLVTLGITPTAPETGYGYIRFAEAVGKGYGHQAYRAERFVEKPNLATAQSYLQDGHYVWNSSMFVWKVETILAELRTHLPELARKLAVIVDALGTPQEHATIDELWPTLATISIDYGVLEKTKNLVVIPVEIGWSDVGSWQQYGALFPVDDQGVRAVGEHLGLGSRNIFVYNTTPRQVYTIGLEDVVVVEMEEATLICHKDHVQRVKELAERQQKLIMKRVSASGTSIVPKRE